MPQTLDEVIAKSGEITDASFSGGIGLNIQQADQFIDFVIDQSVIMKKARVVRMNAKTAYIDKIVIGSGIVKPARAAVNPGNTGSTTPTRVTLSSQEAIAVVTLSDDAKEDNIEGASFTQHLLKMAAAQIANEVDVALLHGKKLTLTGNAGHIRSLWNGFVTQALEANLHLVDANVTFSDRYQSLTVGQNKIDAMIKKLPTKYRAGDLVLLANNYLVQDYINLQQSVTNLAPGAIVGEGDAYYQAIPIVMVPNMRTDEVVSATYSQATTLTAEALAGATTLTVASIGAIANGDTLVVGQGQADAEVVTVSGAPSGNTITLSAALVLDHANGEAVKKAASLVNNGSSMLLTRWANMVVGVQRDIRIEQYRDPFARTTSYIFSMRLDAQMENTDAAVLAYNMAIR